MFDLKDAYTEVDIKELLSVVSELEIWRKYCTNFEEIDKSFCSELYNDRNPGCRIYYNHMNRLIYHDFGTGTSYGCFDYIQAKYHCTFKESLRIIYNDFKLGSIRYDILPQLVLNNAPEVLKMSSKSYIEIVPQAFTLTDYNYWNQYEIPLTLLEEYNVFSCRIVYLHKKDKTITFNYKDDNPIYAYRFCYDGEYSYKIYFPLSPDKKRKWLFSGGSENNIEGHDQLPHFGDNLILTKSLKDCISYNQCGIPAISLQGETNKLKQDLVDKLLLRFDNIIVNYDGDDEGIRGSKRLNQQYGFKYFYTDDYKDLSDYTKDRGLLSAKEMINNKLKQLVNG